MAETSGLSPVKCGFDPRRPHDIFRISYISYNENHY